MKKAIYKPLSLINPFGQFGKYALVVKLAKQSTQQKRSVTDGGRTVAQLAIKVSF